MLLQQHRVTLLFKHLHDGEVREGLIHGLIDQRELIEIQAVCLLTEERLAVLPISDPHNNQFFYSPLQLRAQSGVFHAQCLDHVLFCQIEERVTIDFIDFEFVAIVLELGIGFEPNADVLHAPLTDVLAAHDESCHFAESIELLK